MEEIFGFVGRTLGVTLGVSAVRAMTGGLRPVLREVIRAGVVVGEGVQAVVAGTLGLVASAAAEAGQDLDEARTRSRSGQSARKRDTESRQIAIVKD